MKGKFKIVSVPRGMVVTLCTIVAAAVILVGGAGAAGEPRSAGMVVAVAMFVALMIALAMAMVGKRSHK